MDNFPPVIEYARKKNPFANLNLLTGDLAEFSWKQKFDAIVAADFLEHLKKPGLILRKFHQILNPGGILLLSVPNGFGPFEIEVFLTEKTGIRKAMVKLLFFITRLRGKLEEQPPPPPEMQAPYNENSPHFQHFTLKRLKKLLEKSGFSVEKVRPGAFMGALLTDLFLNRNEGFIRWNVEIAEKLPLFLISTWNIKAKRKNGS